MVEKQPRGSRKSGRNGEIVGFLDIGDDIGGLPQRIGRDRPQADGPVAALAAAGHADDVELDAAAQRMPLKRVGDPGPDLVEGCWRLRKECLEIQVASPFLTGGLWREAATAAADGLRQDSWRDFG